MGANHFFLFSSNLAETPDGTVFTVSNDGHLLQSADTWANWIEYNFTGQVNAVFADDNGDVYFNEYGFQSYLYRLSNPSPGGYTLALISTFDNTPGSAAIMSNMSKVNNSYYFLMQGYGLMRIKDFNSYETLKPGDVYSYCITNSNGAIVSDYGYNIFDHSIYSQAEYNINP